MTTLLIVFFALLGALFGSFAGVLAERLNTGERLASGRSKCNSCGRTLDGLDLIPIFSWFLFAGRCRTCRARVPARYVLTECTLAFLFALAYVKLGLTLPLFVFLFALILLAALTLYDLAHTIVPELLALLLLGTTIVFAFLSAGTLSLLGVPLLTAGVIGLSFFLLHALSGGRAMGLGDAPVALSLSLLVGNAAIPGLLFSFWIGAAVGIGILVGKRKGHRMGIEIPFVPFMVAGFLLAYFTGWNPLSLVVG